MHEYIEDLYELCETIAREIGDANEKIRAAGGKLSGSDVEYVDKLTHTLKSIKAVVAMMEDEDGYSNNYAGNMGGSYARGGQGGTRGGSSNRGGSYARGRGRNARRDSMGRYSSERGYSRAADEFAEKLEDLMEDAPNEKVRMSLHKALEKMQDD